MVQFCAGPVGGKLLAGEELDHFAACFDRFVDGLERGEIVEGPSLDAQGETAGVVFGRDIHGGKPGCGEDAQGAGQNQM